MSARWIKLLRDVRLARGRLLMIVIALAASIAAVVAMLATWTVISREVPRNYVGTNPASAQLEFEGSIDAALLAEIAARPGIAAVELAGTSSARVQVAPDQWLPMRIFVVPDFARLRINTLGREAGAWPPPTGTLLIERSALALSGGAVGRDLKVAFKRSGEHQVMLSGVVHDPGMAPAWQEQLLCGYATPQTMAQLVEPATLDLLKIVVTEGGNDRAAIEGTARALATWLDGRGVKVHEARIPPPLRHPHQVQMETILLMLLMFSFLLLVLGGVLCATIIGALLGEQVRQIAIMKAIGARSGQLAAMYAVQVAALAALALAIAVPLGVAGGRGLIGVLGELLNLRIASTALPWTLFASTVAVGLGVPLLAALVPIRAATRITVQSAMQDRHVSRSAGWLPRWRGLSDPAFLLALRNVARRRTRFALTLLLLSGAGAMFLTSMNLQAGWKNTVAQAAAGRKFDLELRLQGDAPSQRVMDLVGAAAAVRRSEDWSIAAASPAAADGLEISQRYPDGGHGSFALRAAPPDTSLIVHAMKAGRWLRSDDGQTAVINDQVLATVFPQARIGTSIDLTVEGKVHSYRVVGIVHENLAPGAVYVTPTAFAAATGSGGAVNAVRLALADPAKVAAAAAAISAALDADGIEVRGVMTAASFAAAQGGHIAILVWALGFIAAMMAVVGLLGLASSLGSSVLERTREFGILRALGASSSVVVRSVLMEGALTALVSALLALIVAALPSAVVGAILASISNQPLALQLSPLAAALWLGGVLAAALAASYVPATRAARLTIKQTMDGEYA
ncbi:MAG TPA: FtsX-like permease family protein [Burkholderiaceae bacterium]|nr:FtsX-like permease family protein [Burkholderiaceae bacterium]